MDMTLITAILALLCVILAAGAFAGWWLLANEMRENRDLVEANGVLGELLWEVRREGERDLVDEMRKIEGGAFDVDDDPY